MVGHISNDLAQYIFHCRSFLLYWSVFCLFAVLRDVVRTKCRDAPTGIQH